MEKIIFENGVLFLPDWPQSLSAAFLAFYLAREDFHIRGAQLKLASPAYKHIPVYPYISFVEFDHFLTLAYTLSSFFQ